MGRWCGCPLAGSARALRRKVPEKAERGRPLLHGDARQPEPGNSSDSSAASLAGNCSCGTDSGSTQEQRTSGLLLVQPRERSGQACPAVRCPHGRCSRQEEASPLSQFVDVSSHPRRTANPSAQSTPMPEMFWHSISTHVVAGQLRSVSCIARKRRQRPEASFGPLAAPCSVDARLNSTTTFSPAGRRFSKRSVARCAWAVRLTIARPSPLPSPPLAASAR